MEPEWFKEPEVLAVSEGPKEALEVSEDTLAAEGAMVPGEAKGVGFIQATRSIWA